jgi:HK97 gp10 family phage protein
MSVGTINAGKVLGNRELQKALNRIPYAVKKNKFLLAVFRQAAKPIIQAARAGINDDSKQLRRSIKAFSTKASRRLPALYVGPKATGGSAIKDKNRGGGYYGAMLEYGNANSPAHPFMRPAWDKSESTSSAILLAGTKKIVEKVLERELKGLKRIYK